MASGHLMGLIRELSRDRGVGSNQIEIFMAFSYPSGISFRCGFVYGTTPKTTKRKLFFFLSDV